MLEVESRTREHRHRDQRLEKDVTFVQRLKGGGSEQRKQLEGDLGLDGKSFPV